jgi:RNA polymerase sigma factor (sigma-70 family)
MPSPDLNPDWVLSSNSSEQKPQPLDDEHELVTVASRLWPRVQAHARRELANKNLDEGIALATEVWEGVLRSVAKTLQRSNGRGAHVADLDAYLFGAFHHRFNRALKKERRRRETIELVASSRDLEQLPGARDLKSSSHVEQTVQVKEIVQNMDDWTRRVWIAKLYGYTWREIGDDVGLSEQTTKARFHYALRKLAARLRYGK